jgi:chromosomal replication initiator protein
MSEEDAVAGLWDTLLNRLASDARVTKQALGFLSLIDPVAVLGQNLYVDVPNDITKHMIETRIMPLITEYMAVDAAPGAPTQLVLRVNPDLEDAKVVDPTPISVAAGTAGQNHTDQGGYSDQTSGGEQSGFGSELPSFLSGGALDVRNQETRLNPKYTFDSFVIGESNRFPHAAAFAVAEDPARSYNPLFIYGPSGLGKTHLLHAIGHYTIALHPRRKIRYVSSEEFTNEFISSIQSNKAQEFQASYRDVDLLLIDDIQFLQRAEQTQEAFFQIFNTLYNNNEQVVITSDKPPKELGGFEERMLSRFAWGLMTDIQAPALETRIAILRKKADNENFKVPDEIIDYMAQRVSSNIRELEGTLIRVIAYADLNRQPVTMQLVQTILRDLVPVGEEKTTTTSEIMNEVAHFYRITVDDLCGQSRIHAIAQARQIAMYLVRELTSQSLPTIGTIFGNRDHTTVLYACKKVRDDLNRKREIYTHVTELLARIKNQ